MVIAVAWAFGLRDLGLAFAVLILEFPGFILAGLLFFQIVPPKYVLVLQAIYPRSLTVISNNVLRIARIVLWAAYQGWFHAGTERNMGNTKKSLQIPDLLQLAVTTFVFFLAAAAPVVAQQETGTPGSAGATTTIDGKQLPPPPPKFGGVIKESAVDSMPWWAPRIVPPKGAPNVLLIMTDDQGYGVAGKEAS